MSAEFVPPDLRALGRALGFLTAAGEPALEWFSDPLSRLRNIVSHPAQRAGLRDLIRELITAAPLSETLDDQTWHPLLGNQPAGNVYLIVQGADSTLNLGVGAIAHSVGATTTELRVEVPIINASGSGADFVLGQPAHPIDVRLRIEVGWTSPVKLSAIALQAWHWLEGTTPRVQLGVVLEGLSLDGAEPRDERLHGDVLSAETVRLVLGLLRQDATGNAAVAHIVALLGLDGTVPALPLESLTTDAAALPVWLGQVVASGAWRTHLAGLLGGATLSTDGDSAWRLGLLTVPAIDLTLAIVPGTPRRLAVGLTFRVSGMDAEVEASAIVAEVPLASSTALRALTDARATVRLPGVGRIVDTPELRIGSITGGVRLLAGQVRPLLEVDDVHLDGVDHDRLDLTHVESVATTAIATALQAAFGGAGPGLHLAALAGLVAPATDPGAPGVDLTRLATDPFGALAAVQRDRLTSNVHGWVHLFSELGALLGVTDTPSGDGTPALPWTLPLASQGPLSLQLAAWNGKRDADDVDRLVIGLRVAASPAPFTVAWASELLAIDLPISGVPTPRLFGAQHLSLHIAPLPFSPSVGGVRVSAGGIQGRMNWTFGTPALWSATVTDIDVVADGETLHLASLSLPWSGAFDTNDPTTLAASLGLSSAAQIGALVRRLVARGVISWGGSLGRVLGGILGVHASLPGLPDGFPLLSAVSLVSAPFEEVRPRLARLARESSPSGGFLMALLPWIRALLSNELPELAEVVLPDDFKYVPGVGRHDDPWVLEIGGAEEVALLIWLGPDGPPGTWAQSLPATADVRALADALVAWAPWLPELAGVDRMTLGDGLATLDDLFTSSDGVVPIIAQIPSGWAAGAVVAASHDLVCEAPAALDQIVAAVPTGVVTLLLGPSFLDHSQWSALLARVGATAPNFDLRQSTIPPLAIDLEAVTTTSNWYTADLSDSADAVAQIGRLVDRVAALRPGVPLHIVAHSTAGTAARAFCGTSPGRVAGLVTIASPHLGTSPPWISDTNVGAALGVLTLHLGAFPSGPTRDALQFIAARSRGAAGTAPNAWPQAAFAPRAFGDTGTTTTRAIAAAVGAGLPAALRAAFGRPNRPDPQTIGVGLRVRLAAPGTEAVRVSVDLRVDLGDIGLNGSTTGSTRALRLRVGLNRADGWLVGGPGVQPDGTPWSARLRSAEVGVDAVLDSGGVRQIKVIARLRQAGAGVALDDLVDYATAPAQVAALLGVLFHTLPTTLPGTPLGQVLGAFDALGLLTSDRTLAADAFAALVDDPTVYLDSRLRAVFSGGFFGFVGVGPWTRELTNLPFWIRISSAPWSIGLDVRSGEGLPLGTDASLALSGQLAVTDLTGSLTASLRAGATNLSWDGTTARLSVGGWLPDLVVWPVLATTALHTWLDETLPRLLGSAVVSALLEAMLPPGVLVGPIDRFFNASANHTNDSPRLGSNAGLLDSQKLRTLFGVISRAAGLLAGDGLRLPGDVSVAVIGDGTDAALTGLALSTTVPIAGVLGINLTALLDRQRAVTVSGEVTLSLMLGTWGNTLITIDSGLAGVSIRVAPAGVTVPIELFPNFSGLAALGGLTALLPRVLDQLPTGTARGAARSVGEALGVWDVIGGFIAHVDRFRALAAGDWGAVDKANLVTVAASVLDPLVAGLSSSGSLIHWAQGGVLGGQLAVDAGWMGSTPVVHVRLLQLSINSFVGLDVVVGVGARGVEVQADLSITLPATAVQPTLRVSASGTNVSLRLLPLAGAGVDGAIRLQLLPSANLDSDADAAQQTLLNVVFPVAARLMIDSVGIAFTSPLWSGAPSPRDLLSGAHLLDAAGNLTLPVSLAGLPVALAGLLGTLGADLSLGDLTVRVGRQSDGGVGLGVSGNVSLTTSDLEVEVLFGCPAAMGGPSTISLVLFDGVTLGLLPQLNANGIGLGLRRTNGALVANDVIRLDALRSYLFLDADFSASSAHVSGGGLEFENIALPIGQVTSGGVGGGNPVASSLLRSDGAGGDETPIHPTINVDVWYRNGLQIRFSGEVGPLWIGVRNTFGPIYLEQIGVGVYQDNGSTAGVDLLIDGGVVVGPLAAQVDELSVRIPFVSLGRPDAWSLDLKGLALGMHVPGIDVTGGLLKIDRGYIEYDGMLLVKVSQLGMVAVGAYSRPHDEYTSLFIFGALFAVIGLPPLVDIHGLGLGIGYNRRVVIPDDMNAIADFVLVAALDDADKLTNDPMGALTRMGAAMPPERGALWFAFGLHGTTLELVHLTAIVYVALAKGVEIGVLGIARMALPSDDTALVNLELAIKARFSSEESLLSVQGQLTDNSWLLSSDCQLTGGFAYFVWFKESQFILTLGGYHPSFSPRPEFPSVPRLGYCWDLGPIHIKGESYFALTNTCIMAGTRMEAVYGWDWLNFWSTSHADFLLSWDPFHYEVSVGTSIGARFRWTIDVFIGTITISISVSVGGSVDITGPPFHGVIRADLGVTSISIPFGPAPNPEPDLLLWQPFRLKYLQGGDPNGSAFSVLPGDGLLPPEPKGGEPAAGTREHPWHFLSEFSFRTDTRMPAKGYQTFVDAALIDETNGNVYDFDIAPMGISRVGSVHTLTIQRSDGSDLTDEIHTDCFVATPRFAKFAEGTWKYYPEGVPAAARTLPAIAGLDVVATAREKVALAEAPEIDVAHLVDEGPRRPLPFAQRTTAQIAVFKGLGLRADFVTAASANGRAERLRGAAETMLSGGGIFGDLRRTAGMKPLSATSVRTLRHRRSAPPRIAPLSIGLTMNSPALPAAPALRTIEPISSVALTAPRLAGIVQHLPVPTYAAMPLARTTIAGVKAAVGAPRVAPPALFGRAGARLMKMAASDAPRPTSHAGMGRALVHPMSGASLGLAHWNALAAIEDGVAVDGVVVAAGGGQVWDLVDSTCVEVSGNGIARVVALGTDGKVLLDQTGGAAIIDLPTRTARLAVLCLGRRPVVPTEIVGWQTESWLVQVSANALLGTGCALRLAGSRLHTRDGTQRAIGVVRAGEVLSRTGGVETRLDATANVIAVLLDMADDTQAKLGDLAVGIEGATLLPSLPVVAGRRILHLHEVRDNQAGAPLIVSIASSAGWTLAGVVALPGRAREWAARFNGRLPERLVPDAPRTTDGAVRIRIQKGAL